MYMIICPHCLSENDLDAQQCIGCGAPIPKVTPEHIAALNGGHIETPPKTRFKKFVKNDAPKSLKTLFLVSLIVCIVCLLASFGISFAASSNCIADCIAMALTVLVMYLVKSRACSVILLIYSVLASLYGFFISGVFVSVPMIIAGILSTVTFLTLNRAYKKFKTSLEVTI